MSPIRPIVVPELPPAPSTFSAGMLANGFIQVSGQGPIELDGTVRSDLDAADQTRLTLQNVCRVLEAAGASFADVVMLRVYLTDRADFGSMNTAFEEFVARGGAEAGPARTTVIVGLPFEGMRVEIDALAVATHAQTGELPCT